MAPAPFRAIAGTLALTVLDAAIGTVSVLRLVVHAGSRDGSWAVRATLAPAIVGASAVTGAVLVISASVGTH